MSLKTMGMIMLSVFFLMVLGFLTTSKVFRLILEIISIALGLGLGYFGYIFARHGKEIEADDAEEEND